MTSIATSVHRKLLYRTARLLVILCAITALVIPAAGQFRKARRQSKLRALGLLEFGPNNRVRLIPIAIFVDGTFYDASIYRATPVPMALEPGTVYEAFRTGSPVGLFTITRPETLAGNWRAQGNWKLEGATSSMAKKKPGFKAAPKEEDDRPILRRPGSASPQSTSAPTTPAPGPAKSTAPPGPTAPPAPANASTPPASSQGSEDEGGRPVLRRGKPGEEQAAEIPEPGSAPTKQVKTTSKRPPVVSTLPGMLPGGVQALPAISDAEVTDSHPYTFDLRPEEREIYTKKMAQLASVAVEKFEKTRDPHFASCTLADAFLRAFDPDFSNEADLVYSSHCTLTSGEMREKGRRTASRTEPASAKPGEAWVTVVARVDLEGEPRQLFASVTDSNHLDEVPRLELIDAVDARGDGRGDLLFREINDSGRAFIVYQIGADQLYPLFEGGSGQ